MVAKPQMYKEAGVPLNWLVDPDALTVTVIAAGTSTKVLKSNDTLAGGNILPEFSGSVAKLFT